MSGLATLSLDLDNEWSYLKTRGDPAWESLPSYLERALDHALALLGERGLRVTFFVVGRDAEDARHREALARIPAAGHEVGNHSFHHDPWLHLYADDALEREVVRAEECIEEATGVRPEGFRGPGYSVTPTLLQLLADRGYRYDASSLPTFVGPLARAYYFVRADLSKQERRRRVALFGSLRDGLRPLRPYRLGVARGELLEIPVTTFPGLRMPFHVSYVLWLCTFSPHLGRAYFRAALATCRLCGVEPSILLHPLDLLGGDDVPSLRFFPAMEMPGARKRELLARCLDDLRARFRVVPLGAYARELAERSDLAVRPAAALGLEGER